MRGFVDLHSHWVASIDDGVRTIDEGIALLSLLHQAGFSHVVATPHMRPGMFENDKASLEAAYQKTVAQLHTHVGPLPTHSLASEHFFDDVVFERLLQHQGLPYRSHVLIEFPPTQFPQRVAARFVDLKRKGLGVVLAHPERYQPVWENDQCLDDLLDVGAHLLLDLCALVGKYGKAPQKAAEKLLAEDAYEAACSDAHRPADVDDVVRSIERLQKLVGVDEAKRLLITGPTAILDGLSQSNP